MQCMQMTCTQGFSKATAAYTPLYTPVCSILEYLFKMTCMQGMSRNGKDCWSAYTMYVAGL